MNPFGICAWLAVFVAGVLVTSQKRKARLASLFLLYLLAGLSCLLSGATLLGFSIWMVGLLLALSVMVHVPVFGNRDEDREVAVTGVVEADRRLGLVEKLKQLSPVIVTALVTIAAGLYGMGGDAGVPAETAPSLAGTSEAGGISEFSAHLVSKDWLKLELVGILLLVSVIGAGATTRAERIQESTSGKGQRA